MINFLLLSIKSFLSFVNAKLLFFLYQVIFGGKEPNFLCENVLLCLFLSCNHLLRGNGLFSLFLINLKPVFIYSVLPTNIFQNFWTLLLGCSKIANDYFKRFTILATLVFFHLLGGTRSLIIIIYFSCQKVPFFSLIFCSTLVKMLLINGQ